jgi:3'-5' exoribonuclease
VGDSDSWNRHEVDRDFLLALGLMKSPYISDLEPNQVISGIFLVHHKDIRQKKSGDPYLSLTLADRTGDLDAKMWDNAAEVLDAFERDDFVRVKGLYQIFQNRPQLTVHKIAAVPEAEVEFGVSTRDREEMFRELQSWIASMTNSHLRGLLEAIFADETIAVAYRTAPAAKSIHHAWIGGLIEHVLSLCHLAKFCSAHYPDVDFDLLLSGVILHDIGKIHELTYARGFNYTTEGQLLGHIVIGMRMVEEKLRAMPDFPAPLRDLLLHMILSHHGEMAFGSPKVPVFAEALLLHHLDNLDSKMEHLRGLVEKDRLVSGVWTGYSPALDRSLLKKRRFLDPAPAAEAALDPAAAKAEPSASKASREAHPPAPNSAFASKLQQALGRDN